MQWTKVFDDKFKSACLSGKSCIFLTPLFSQKLKSLDVLPPSEFPPTICLRRGKYGYFLEPYILFSIFLIDHGESRRWKRITKRIKHYLLASKLHAQAKKVNEITRVRSRLRNRLLPGSMPSTHFKTAVCFLLCTTKVITVRVLWYWD